MELFVNSRHPSYKQATGASLQQMDHLFAQGMIEKGIYAYEAGQKHIETDPSFGSKPEIDSVVVKFPSGKFAVALFEPSQAESAQCNSGLFILTIHQPLCRERFS